MQAEDIKEAIPPLGLRIEFREKLFTWKKVQVRRFNKYTFLRIKVIFNIKS